MMKILKLRVFSKANNLLAQSNVFQGVSLQVVKTKVLSPSNISGSFTKEIEKTIL